jgi:heme-degrading monooxygenase HmoA
VSDARPVVSVLRLYPLAGREQELVRAYDELEVFRRAAESAGMRASRLLEPVEPGMPLLVIAEWDDAADYERWLASPVRAEIGGTLTELVAEAPGSIYREAVAWPGEGRAP